MKRNKEGRLEFSSTEEQKAYENRRAVFLSNQDKDSIEYLKDRYCYYLHMAEGYKEKIYNYTITKEAPHQQQNMELMQKTILEQQVQIDKLAAAFTKLKVSK